jgi:RimJ/RimL family protein N-acetyltransferase
VTPAFPSLHTPRLVLRGPAPGDAARLAALAHDFDVVRMTSRMPYPYTAEDAEAFLERAGAKDLRSEVTWVVQDGEGPIGALGLFPGDPPSPGPELGYWLGRPAWGRGYASEAVEAAVAWADDVWRRRCLTARCFVDNPASMRVLDKAGFLPTGVVELSPSLARGAPALSRQFIRLP